MTIALEPAETDTAKVTNVSFMSGEHSLKGTLFAPKSKPSAIVVCNGATGVPARYYTHFARWLASERQIACLVYDYRDFGESMSASTKQSRATMVDWGVYDQEAARDFARATFPDVPLWVLGHSLGAMCIPFQRNLDGIDRVIAVASGLVNVREHPWPYQIRARLFWYGLVPVLTRLRGYLPGSLVGLKGDLPQGVYWQWRRWCTRRNFYADDIGQHLRFPDFSNLKARSKFVAVSDDVMVPPKSVWRLMQCYPTAPKTQKVLRPGDYGLSEIGHIRVFSEMCKAAWPDIIQ